MATRALQVVITGDTKQFSRSLDRAGKDMGTLEGTVRRSAGRSAKALVAMSAAAAGLAAVGLKKSVDAALESEKANARLQAQLKATGISYDAHAKQIDAVIQKHSQLAGIDDEDLQDAFTNIVRASGSLDVGLRRVGLAADIARAKHIDVAKAGDLVGKVSAGNTGILARYGIVIDKGATATEALGQLQQKFAGQAEAYGKTTAGSLDRAQVASENLGEIVGSKLTPLLAKAATALVDLVDKAGRLGGPIRTATGTVRDAYDDVVGAVRRFASRNREELQTAAQAMRNLGKAAKFVFEEIILPTIRTAIRRIGPILDAFKDTVSGLVRFVTNVLTGRWSKAWEAFKDVVKGNFRLIFNIIRGAVETLGTLALKIGGAIVKGVTKGLGSVGHAILGRVKEGISWAAKQTASWLDKANPFSIAGKVAQGIGDGVGKNIGKGALPQGGAFGGSLMGARTAMKPFAAIGSRFGLQVSSGRRAGAVTSSGNTSWHSTGEAIDMSGPAPGMMAFFKTLRSRFGGRLAELIYTPGGAGIKNGQPYRYGGQVAADHFDHVHVAFDSGRPGIGDGIGQIRNLWTRAGGSPSAANIAAAIAMAESSGNPGASNRNTDGSVDRGLWQINSVHGALSTFDRLANARAAVQISSNGRNWSPWVTYKTGAYRRFLGGGGGSSRGGGSRMTPAQRSAQQAFRAFSRGARGAAGEAVRQAGLTGPGFAGTYEQQIANVGVQEAAARAKDNLPALIKALQREIRIKRRRLKRVRRTLKKRIGRDARQRLTEERGSLISEIAELAATLKEYRADAAGGATTITAAEGLEAGVAPEGQALNAGGTALVDVADAPTQTDFANLALAEAQRTPDTADDATALNTLLGISQANVAAARATGDPRKILEALQGLWAIEDQIKQLQEPVTNLTEEIKSLQAEIKRNNDFAASVAGIATREAIKALADVISGQIVGTNLQGRRLTAGNGTIARTP